MPQTPADCALRDSFQREPDPPPAWSRKSRQRPLVEKYHRLLAILTIINSSICANSNAFKLCSTRESFNRLQRFCSYQGELQTNKLSSLDRAMVQQHLRNSTDLFSKATGDHPHVFSAIVNSGCTHSTTNSFSDVDPKSIRKLSKPLNVGGVGGDILVEYVGRSNWETFDDFGNLLPLMTRRIFLR